MAFPVREATATTFDIGDPATVNLPASIASGDVLLISILLYTGAIPTTPSGWSLLTSVSGTYWYKRTADGGEGATVTIDLDTSGSYLAIAERWSGSSGNVEAATGVTSLDVPSLTPSWGAKDTVWVTSLGSQIGVSGDNDSVPPTNYGNPVERAAGFVGLMTSYRELNATSEDPGSWTQPEGSPQTTLIAIEPETTVSAAVGGTLASGTTEAHIVAGGRVLTLTLTGDTWVASGATFNAQRQAIIDGIDSAQAEAAGWDAVVKAGLAVTDVVRTSDTVVTITLPAFASFNITATETITATIPAAALTGASPIVASPTFTVAVVPFATISGTATDGISEVDVVAGGKTVIITLNGDTWVAAGATFEAQRQAIIDGLDSAQAEATGWNAEVRDNLAVTDVVRTSATVVTVTLSAQAAYDITAQETITVTVPASALTGNAAIVGSPTFTVNPQSVDTGSNMTYAGAIARRRGRR